MPRNPRLFVPGATYHVYCRVARGEFVFRNQPGAEVFTETLRDVRDLDALDAKVTEYGPAKVIK